MCNEADAGTGGGRGIQLDALEALSVHEDLCGHRSQLIVEWVSDKGPDVGDFCRFEHGSRHSMAGSENSDCFCNVS